jgi:3-oxoacyl-[acyl-carrier-protein] synthase II
MNLALANSGIYPEQVDYVCANAYGSPQGDSAEVAWIKKCLGNRAYQIPVSSTRGVLGHALSAAGMSQLITCALMMKHEMVIPTANLQYPDPECDLDHVPLKPRRARVGIALANSHGIGGENGTIVVKRVK